MKECGSKWKEIEECDKTDYKALAETDAIRHSREIKAYVPDIKDAEKENKKKAKKRKSNKDPNAPKRPQSAFFIFSGEKRDVVKAELGGNHRIQEVARKLGEMWNALTDEEKLPFQERAQIRKDEYVLTKAAYDQGVKSKKVALGEIVGTRSESNALIPESAYPIIPVLGEAIVEEVECE